MSPKKKQLQQLTIKLVRSGIGCTGKQQKVIQGLGLRKLNQVVSRPDTPAVRGMVFKIRHLVEVAE